MYALPKSEAFERMRGKDQRPLLIVRECGLCKGDDAFLSRTLANDKTLLLSQWFHCVKLKQHVITKDHTFHRLFEGENPPHLLLATADGSTIVPLPGDQSQTKLWEAMFKILKLEYRRDAKRAFKDLQQLLSQYDHLDSMEDLYLEQIDVEIEKRGPRSSKLKTLRKKLATIGEKKKATMEREKKIVDLGLKRTEKAATKK